MTTKPAYRKKLIEVSLPLEAINRESAREKSIRHGHPSTLHLWWARRPLAACRAVLFAQLVDDPSSWPDLFPTEEAQDRERQRLFRLIEELVQWKNSNNDTVLNAARLEIARSVARGRQADSEADERDTAVLQQSPPAKTVNTYLAEVAPPVHDPFAGGGSIPLEAQRLGLRAYASDLNPVAVLINKALIEIPPKFADQPPVNPRSRVERDKQSWRGAQGLAEDVRYYGEWMREEAFQRIGHLYPKVHITEEMAAEREDLQEYLGQELTVISWIWARTVASPNPACDGAHVPLVSTYWLGKKKGKEAWLQPLVNRENNTWTFTIGRGTPADVKATSEGTKAGRGNFRCILSDEPISADYTRKEGQAGRIGSRLIAVVAEGQRGRVYLPATEDMENIAAVPLPEGAPETNLPQQALGFRVQNYGMTQHKHLFTPRQLTALVTFSDLIAEVREKVAADAQDAGLDEGAPLAEDGSAAQAYADAVAVYLGCATGRSADLWSGSATWTPAGEFIGHTFTRHALSMVWDYAEGNPFSNSTGYWLGAVEWVGRAISFLPKAQFGSAVQHDARAARSSTSVVVSSDPPYYDNVPYADLSDFFYVWLRRSLRSIFPSLFGTMLVPKEAELVAEPFRHGSKEAAEAFFMKGMSQAIARMAETSTIVSPATIYYAFKQSEVTEKGSSSTGWETFLDAVVLQGGFSVVGTWPVRTERSNRTRGLGSNALASSIVLVCRKREEEAQSITRAEFRRLLRRELPEALQALQKGNIAPVDMAQSSIGPGMAINSRYAKVLEADGSAMTVRTALQLINQALDEYLTEEEGDLDGDTRFAVTWFETHQFGEGSFGEAETLAKARNVSVSGIAEAGILHSAAGKVRLLQRAELPDEWSPADSRRLSVWLALQHLIKRLEAQGESAAASLLAQLGDTAELVRDLAYRLYSSCERRHWAEEARAYNGLVISYPELTRLAQEQPEPTRDQGELF